MIPFAAVWISVLVQLLGTVATISQGNALGSLSIGSASSAKAGDREKIHQKLRRIEQQRTEKSIKYNELILRIKDSEGKVEKLDKECDKVRTMIQNLASSKEKSAAVLEIKSLGKRQADVHFLQSKLSNKLEKMTASQIDTIDQLAASLRGLDIDLDNLDIKSAIVDISKSVGELCDLNMQCILIKCEIERVTIDVTRLDAELELVPLLDALYDLVCYFSTPDASEEQYVPSGNNLSECAAELLELIDEFNVHLKALYPEASSLQFDEENPEESLKTLWQHLKSYQIQLAACEEQLKQTKNNLFISQKRAESYELQIKELENGIEDKILLKFSINSSKCAEIRDRFEYLGYKNRLDDLIKETNEIEKGKVVAAVKLERVNIEFLKEKEQSETKLSRLENGMKKIKSKLEGDYKKKKIFYSELIAFRSAIENLKKQLSAPSTSPRERKAFNPSSVSPQSSKPRAEEVRGSDVLKSMVKPPIEESHSDAIQGRDGRKTKRRRKQKKSPGKTSHEMSAINQPSGVIPATDEKLQTANPEDALRKLKQVEEKDNECIQKTTLKGNEMPRIIEENDSSHFQLNESVYTVDELSRKYNQLLTERECNEKIQQSIQNDPMLQSSNNSSDFEPTSLKNAPESASYAEQMEELARLFGQIRDLTIANDGLVSDKSKWESERKRVLAEKEELYRTMRLLRDSNEEMTIDLEDLKNINQSLEERNSALLQRNKQHLLDAEKIDDENGEMRLQIAALEKRINQLEDENLKLSNEKKQPLIDKQNQESKDSGFDSLAFTQEKERLASQLQVLTAENNRLLVSIESLTKENIRVTEDNEGFITKINQFVHDKQLLVDKSNQLESDKQSLICEKSRLMTNNQTMQDQVASMQEEMASMRDQVTSMQDKLASVQNEMAMAQDQVEKIQKEKQTLVDENIQLVSDKQSLTTDVAALKSENQTIQVEKIQLKNKNQALDTKIAQLEQQIVQLSSTATKAATQHPSYNSTVLILISTISILGGTLVIGSIYLFIRRPSKSHSIKKQNH